MTRTRARLRASPVALAGSARVRNQARRRVRGAAASSTSPATASIVAGCSRGYRDATQAAAIPAAVAMAMRTRRGIGGSDPRDWATHPTRAATWQFSPRHRGKTPAMPRATSDRQGNAIPALEARRGDLASRVAAALRGQHPAWIFAGSSSLGFVALAGLTIAVGQVLVGTVLPPSGRSAEDHINTWLAAHRSSTLDAASAVGSAIGDMPVLPAVVVATVLVLLWRRRVRMAAFIVGAAAVELATYRVASLVVHRDRPPVVAPRRPAGGPELPLRPRRGVGRRLRRRGAAGLLGRPQTLGLAPLLDAGDPAAGHRGRSPACTAGMHHLTDVGAGVLVGVGALLVA